MCTIYQYKITCAQYINITSSYALVPKLLMLEYPHTMMELATHKQHISNTLAYAINARIPTYYDGNTLATHQKHISNTLATH